jgi:hypothetical protein
MFFTPKYCFSITSTLSQLKVRRLLLCNDRWINVNAYVHEQNEVQKLFQTIKQSQQCRLSLRNNHFTQQSPLHCMNNRYFTSTSGDTDSAAEPPSNMPQGLVTTNFDKLVTTLPYDDSHFVTVSDELVNLATENSLAVRRSRRQASVDHTNNNGVDEESHRGYIDSILNDKNDDEGNDENDSDDADDTDYDQTTTLVKGVPLITYEGEETYFQFDYRNHKTEINTPMSNLLRKIETTLHNAHLEPFGRYRGVGTLKSNIENMQEGERFRLGRGRSLKKDGVIVQLRRKKVNTTGFIKLKYALLRLLKDRQAIYGSGNTNTITELKWKQIGRSFFGPDSDICIKYKEAEGILRDLWFRGKSDKFNHLQKWHFRLVQKKKERLLHPRDPNEPITPKATKQKKYIPRQPSKNRFLWDDKRMAILERQIKYA